MLRVKTKELSIISTEGEWKHFEAKTCLFSDILNSKQTFST